ncbi:MAG: hypothetical protein A4E65_00113 [Syntrophorhabdus sp. PtaU1.Bin153]|nr:MAG: hypothetical protein A4E65_00113 [Syntrophorhabdus sp. PtaU1.Bin153]
MDQSDRNHEGNKKRERDAKRQKLFREGKKKKGRYVNLFVPQDVARKIEGKPSLLVKRFLELSEVMDLLEQQDEVIRELRSRREMRRTRQSQQFEKEWFERRFGQSSEKEVLERANGERQRLEKVLAEERSEHDAFRRSVYVITEAAGGLVQKVLDESEGYLETIQAISKALLNPRIKNERMKALAIDRIRQECKSVIERATAAHETNKAAYDRLFGRWSSERLRGAIDT